MEFNHLGFFLLAVLWYPFAYATGLIVVIIGLTVLPVRFSSYWKSRTFKRL